MASLDPRSGGSLSSTSLHAPCDGELTTYTQASLALLAGQLDVHPSGPRCWKELECHVLGLAWKTLVFAPSSGHGEATP